MTRGDVHRVRLQGARGHEQRGPRFVVVVQADEFLGLSTVVIAPTSQSAAGAAFRPSIEVEGQMTRVLVEQMRVVDLDRLGPSAGHLTPSEQRSVDEALTLVLGLR